MGYKKAQSYKVMRFSQSLALWPDDAIQQRLKDVEVALAADKEQKKRFSELLRTGHELERQGDYAGAVQKYRESLVIQPDKRLENHITQRRDRSGLPAPQFGRS